MRQITSRDNPAIKELAKLMRSRRDREEQGCYVLEGARLVCDAAISGVKIITVYATADGIRRAGTVWNEIASIGECCLIDEASAQKIADTRSTQGIFAHCEGVLTREGLPEHTPRGALLLASLQDPGNVGTILRSADAFGLSAVILSADCPEPTSPKVLRASMGAAFRVPLYCTSDMREAVDTLRARGVRVCAAALSPDSRPIGETDLSGAAVAIGNEGAGLPPSLIERCDVSVSIPISSGCESLNAAMAATIFAWELAKAGGAAR